MKKQKIIKDYFVYIISFILITISIYYVFKGQSYKFISRISIFSLIISIAFTILRFACTGLKLSYLVKKNEKINIGVFNTITLPIAMNFMSYLIPIKGGFVYQILFFKMKYKINISSGAAIGLFNYLIILIISGIIAMYHFFSTKPYNFLVLIISVLLIFNPIFLKSFHYFIKKIKIKKKSIFMTAIEKINLVLNNLFSLFSDVKTLFIILLLSVVGNAIRVLWFWFSARAIGFEFSFQAIIILSVITEISSIIRFLPGNLGLNEVIFGSTNYILGNSTSEGILFALFIRVSILFVTFTLGLIIVICNLKYFKVKDIKSLWRNIKNQESKID